MASSGELEKLMKLEIKIHSGSKTSDHEFELSTRAGVVQGRTGAASSGAKIQHPAPRQSPESGDGHGAMEKPQPLLQDDAKLGDPHKAPLEERPARHTNLRSCSVSSPMVSRLWRMGKRSRRGFIRS